MENTREPLVGRKVYEFFGYEYPEDDFGIDFEGEDVDFEDGEQDEAEEFFNKLLNTNWKVEL